MYLHIGKGGDDQHTLHLGQPQIVAGPSSTILCR
jgi:hypothetical protein